MAHKDNAPEPPAATDEIAPKPTTPALPVLERTPEVEPLHNLAETRAIFWQNVVREMLITLPALAAAHPEVLDGRMAVLTRAGERIPIAGVEPLFPCSLLAPEAQQLCHAVQGTVFNILTPTGEVFTLPLHEIRAVHSLTNELLEELERLARSVGDDDAGSSEPFGFAAYKSMRKQRRRENSNDQSSDQQDES